MYDFSVKIAGFSFEITAKHRLIYDMCSAYITNDATDAIQLSVSGDEISEQMQLFSVETPPDVCESVCIHRKVAEELALRGAAAFHGAAISYKGKALLFTAPSGTGKSTHIKLWRRYIGKDIGIINGDKPIIAKKNGRITVFSSPWAGKEQWQKNTEAPLCAICIIERSADCNIRPAKKEELISKLLKQVYLPATVGGTEKTLELFDFLCNTVPVYILECDISENAVKTSFEALTGDKYTVVDRGNSL